MRTHPLRAALALLATALLVGCSGGGAGDSGGGSDGAAEDAGSQGLVDPAADAAGEDGAERQVIVTASASVTVDDVGTAADEVASRTEGLGGRVESRDEVAAGPDTDVEPGWAELVLRVPAEELQGLLTDLDDVGEVRQVTQNESDVTDVARDLDARVAALETSTDRLLAIMADAQDTGDLLATEGSLSERQAELEALQAERDALAGQVAMSTLSVSLSAQAPPPVVAQGGFVGGLQSGWQALQTFVGGTLVVLGALLPWVVVLAVPVGTFLLVRHSRGRRRSPAPGTPPAEA